MQTISGKIIAFLPKQEGTTAKGSWVRAGIVIEHGSVEYPKKAAFTIFGEQRLQQCSGLKEGMNVNIDFVPESREYNGKWFTDNTLIRIINADAPAPQGFEQQSPAPTAQSQAPQFPSNPAPMANNPQTTLIEDDDLPF